METSAEVSFPTELVEPIRALLCDLVHVAVLLLVLHATVHTEEAFCGMQQPAQMLTRGSSARGTTAACPAQVPALLNNLCADSLLCFAAVAIRWVQSVTTNSLVI